MLIVLALISMALTVLIGAHGLAMALAIVVLFMAMAAVIQDVLNVDIMIQTRLTGGDFTSKDRRSCR